MKWKTKFAAAALLLAIFTMTSAGTAMANAQFKGKTIQFTIANGTPSTIVEMFYLAWRDDNDEGYNNQYRSFYTGKLAPRKSVMVTLPYRGNDSMGIFIKAKFESGAIVEWAHIYPQKGKTKTVRLEYGGGMNRKHE